VKKIAGGLKKKQIREKSFGDGIEIKDKIRQGREI
jgi:hypothetical protein